MLSLKHIVVTDFTAKGLDLMPLDNPTQRVGKTDLFVPRFGLGSAPLTHPSFTQTVTRDEAAETVRYALAQGLNFIDTAPHYGAGNSEIVIGQTLTGIPRSSYILGTKVGRLVNLGVESYFDYTRDGILRTIDESLKRLQVDHFDILHLHDPDDHYREALDIAFPILDDLRRQGAIKAIGAGMNQWQMLRDFANNADFDCFLLAGRYTLLEQESLDFLSLCQQKQISVFLGGIYNSGILATGPIPNAKYNYADAPQNIIDRVKKIEGVCNRHNVPLRIAALQFAGAHPAVTTLIVGLQTRAQIDDLIKSWQTPLPAELWADLRSAGLIDQRAPVPA
jgi:D-threo-aldose 1-dehydrogenase